MHTVSKETLQALRMADHFSLHAEGAHTTIALTKEVEVPAADPFVPKETRLDYESTGYTTCIEKGQSAYFGIQYARTDGHYQNFVSLLKEGDELVFGFRENATNQLTEAGFFCDEVTVSVIRQFRGKTKVVYIDFLLGYSVVKDESVRMIQQ